MKAIEAITRPIQVARQEELFRKRKNVPAGTPNINSEQTSPFPEAERPAETMAQTSADALIRIAEHFVATAGGAEAAQGMAGSERCQILLLVDLETLQGTSNGTKPGISPITARHLSCDASLLTVLEDDRGNVLNIGLRSRTVPPTMTRVLRLRDKTCRFPGCCESKYVDAHHVKHWADGDETRLDNLVTLCRHHHRLLHRGVFRVAMDTSGESPQPVFKTPAGRRIEPSVYPQFENVSAETSVTALRHAAPEVDDSTCITHWKGEDCDFAIAVDALLLRDREFFTHASSG